MSKMKNKLKRVLSLCLVLMLVVTFVQVSVPVKADAADTAEAADMTDMTVDAATDATDTADTVDTTDTTEAVDKADITEVTDEADTADAVDATDTTDTTDKANIADVADTISDVAVTADTTDFDVTINYAGRQVQTWTAPYSGYYYVEAYGAAGGDDASRGGYGGYVKMYTYLNEGTNLYITCGQKGWTHYFSGYPNIGQNLEDNPTYNGGARASNSHGDSGVGGGATSIAISNHGELKDFANCKNDVLMVAGGGAGGSSQSSGSGGLVLYAGSGTNYSVINGADTSLLNGQFALGSPPVNDADGGGGGGGWIGGKSGLDAAGNSAGGGASFVNTSQRCIPIELVPDYNTKDGYVHITSTDYTEYYAISYDYDGGVAENPISYSVIQDDFTLAKPTKEGYTFTGWTGSNGDTPQKDVIIKKGTAKNLSFKANWEINYYTLDLNSEVDGEYLTRLPDGCTCDLYINGQLEESGIVDVWKQYPYGTTYEFKNFKTGVNLVYANKVQSTYHDSEGCLDENCQPLKGIVKAYMNSSKYGGLTHVVPVFNTKSVNVTFHRNISSSDTQTTSQKVTYGVANQKFAANIFVNNGYTFKGWSFAPNAVNADYPDNCIVADEWIDLHYPKVDLYAVWEPISWTVKYDANGGTGTMADSKHVYKSGSKLNQNQFSKTGYTFNGWQVSRVRNGKTEWLCANTDNSWINGSEWYEKDKIPSNRKTYHFYDNQVMHVCTYIDGDVLSCHAQWTANTHKNRFWHFVQGFKNAEGNSTNKRAYKVKEDSSVSFTYGQRYTIDESYATQIPNGCYLDSSFGSSWHVGTNGIWEPGDWLNYKMGTTIVQADGSMFFEYDYYPYDYTITYNLNGGTNNNANPSTYTVLYGVTLKNPTRTGYTFIGWYDENGNKVTGINESCNATFSSADDLYTKLATRTTGNKTLTARWEPIHYTVKYDANGGTGTMASQDITYTDIYGNMTNTTKCQYTKNGYLFDGWYASRMYNGKLQYLYASSSSGRGEWYDEGRQPSGYSLYKYSNGEKTGHVTTVDKDVITFHAQWKPITWTVKYDANGGSGTMADTTHKYMVSVQLNKNTFVRNGYTFNGWVVSRVRNGKTEWLCGKTEGSWIDSWISGAEWYEKENMPSNRKLYHFADSQVMYRSTYIDGDVITAHAQWQINTYDLSVKHTVSGNMGNKCSDFSFTLNLSGMSGNNITAVFTDASGKKITKTLAMNNGKVAFTLKHGETVVFKNVPYNTSYTITEDNVRDYIVSSSNASGKVTDNTVATFTSVRNIMVPTSADTNIIAMISIICVAGVAILLILKRRKTK